MPELLLIGTSARVLLESAQRGGYRAAALDGFCDREVMMAAIDARRVRLRGEGGLDDAALAAAIKDLGRVHAKTLKAVVAGSGMEGCAAAFAAIRQSGLPWCGNAPECFQHAARKAVHKSPRLHAAAVSTIADRGPPYLYKSANGSGGVHIVPARYRGTGEPSRQNGRGHQQDCRPSYRPSYRQSYLSAMSISHLFLAAGKQIQTVGFSTQWHVKHNPARPFCFGGAINAHSLSETAITQAEAVAQELNQKLNLKGLNNIDYLYDGSKLYFLELNPRPSATMALYDSDYPGGLLHAHIEACQRNTLAESIREASKRTGKAVSQAASKEAGKTPSPIRAFAILYAARATHLPASFEWPNAAKDVPAENRAGYYFEKNAPLCTLPIEADDTRTALSGVQKMTRELQAQIVATQCTSAQCAAAPRAAANPSTSLSVTALAASSLSAAARP